MIIYIDESGTLPDPKDDIVVVAAVGTSASAAIDEIVKTIRKRTKFHKPLEELKFYTASEKVKTLFFQKINKIPLNIFVLIVGKMGKNIPDTPKHFALMSWLLLSNILAIHRDIKKVIFDRHFHRDKDIEAFNHYLKKYLNKDLDIMHVDSRINKKVNIADMVAGAVLAKERNKETEYYQMFRDKITSEIIIKRSALKSNLFRK